MEKSTISVAFVTPLLEGLRRRGFDGDELLDKAGIPPALTALPHARVSAASYATLLRLTAQVLDDEFFGQDRRRMKVGSFAMLGRILIHCDRLDKALDLALRYYALQLDDVYGSLRRDGDLVWLALHPRDAGRPVGVFAQETMLMFIHRLACWLVNRRIAIQRAAFSYAAPPHHGEYDLLFCSGQAFGQPFTGLAMEARSLTLPVARRADSLRDFLSKAPENLLFQYKNGDSMTIQILRRLGSMAPADWPSLEQLARDLRTSTSTIRRRLESEGQYYQGLKDQVRRDMAINLLNGTGMSVMDIGAELGFAETSAFHRAFKKWTGANPGEYRRTLSRATPSS
ncbi:urease operon transcriptional activator [mine drainage metagenome]|uniref:Urease operon transcriptional activator n=1 Tax=mine drainage metagenome TaxID=410659 RepID=A0A1J5RM01_9ZZZZ